MKRRDAAADTRLSREQRNAALEEEQTGINRKLPGNIQEEDKEKN